MLTMVLIFNLFQGAAFADSPLPMSYSQEVPIWPGGSKVLADGIKTITGAKDFVHDPAAVVTHPTFLLYSPTTHSARSAVIVFPGGGYKALAIGK
ncbi:MAG: hypothetical protein NUW21_10595, partial [Elusimicrobia bacterium]|nr:hypothetical protein [Elusimicrobiota bacterium]